MQQMTLISGVERRRRWSETQKQAILIEAFGSGAKVAEGVRIEIHPAWAIDAAEVKEQLQQLNQHSDASPSQRVEFVSDTFLR